MDLSERWHSFALVALFGGSVLLLHACHYVDTYGPLVVGGSVLAVPVLTSAVLSVTRQVAANFEYLKKIYRCSIATMVVFAVLLLFNRFFDRSPANAVQASVVEKDVRHGRGSSSYYLVLAPSWRPGRTGERFYVSEDTFSSVYEGERVTIYLHKGLLGLSWYDTIEPH